MWLKGPRPSRPLCNCRQLVVWYEKRNRPGSLEFSVLAYVYERIPLLERHDDSIPDLTVILRLCMGRTEGACLGLGRLKGLEAT